MPVRCCSRRRSMRRRAVAVTSFGSTGFTSQAVSPSSRPIWLGSSSVGSTRPRVETACSRAAASRRCAVASCRPPVRMMAAGSLPLTAWRTSSSDETMAVSRPPASRPAFTRTAVSRSSVVTMTLSGMRRLPSRDQIHGVIHELAKHGQAFFHAVRRAGEIDDQRLPPSPGPAARQPRAREVRSRGRADGLGDPFGFALEDCGGGFGGHVALRESCTAGREHDVYFVGIGPACELARDAVRFVGDDAPHDDFVATGSGPGDDGITGSVHTLSERTEIRDRQDPDTQFHAFGVVHFFVRCGTKGIFITSAATFLPRMSISNFTPGLVLSFGKYVVPIAALTVGVTVPLRTMSTCRPSRNTG